MHTSTKGIMRKLLLGLLFLVAGMGIVFSQDSAVQQTVTKSLVKAPFESGYFIDDQTVAQPPAHSLQLVIQHRFGTIQKGWDDLAGIWGSSNIRFGLDYTITKNLLIGIGTTKLKRYQDLQVKYTFAHQRQGGFPLTIAVYGNLAINCTNKSNFGTDFKWVHRFSYFGEFMFARRFCKVFSAQFGIGWVHFNQVDSTMKETHANSLYNDNLYLSGIGRVKISPQSSLILSYSQSVFSYLNKMPWPNVGLGVEISTSTHAFQVYIAAAQGILPQEISMYNNNNPYNGALLIGFNITRLWTF
jgi:hypothetical protein